MMNIEVYSIKSFTGKALKSKLESELASRNLPYQVKEYNEVDDFIRAGLTSVPALKIGNSIIEHHDEISFDATVQKALDLISASMERSILVPVDFSSESIHALHYARILAVEMNLGITVVHVHQPLFDPVTGSAFDQAMMQKNQERLSELVLEMGWDYYHSGSRVPVETQFIKGDVASSLLKLSEEDKYELVVLSTKAEDSFMKRMLGSVSTRVSKLGSKPVLVVPPTVPLKFPGKIVVGMTEDLLKENNLSYILDFAAEQEVILDFVFALDDPESFRRLKKSLMERIIQMNINLPGYNIRSVPLVNGAVHEALSNYAKNARAGMLVLVTRHRNFIESLTHQSVSKKALLHPCFPVMLLHA